MDWLPANATAEYREGYEAADKNQTANDCPYAFWRIGCTQEEFDAKWRPKLDLWFIGWKENLRERGLGYNFKPLRSASSSDATKG